MVGTAIVLGADRSPNTAVVQVAGTSLRIAVADLIVAMAASRELSRRLLLYIHTLGFQVAHTVLANTKGSVDERLARWLLMANDRIDGNKYPQTHEFLSIMLGVRRAGVTVALHRLEGAGLIRATRGIITIVDRAGLERYADAYYGAPEKEYERLLGG